MTTAMTKADGGINLEAIVVRGDLAQLSPGERAGYYVRVCEATGLNPATQPFAYLKLNGKEILYAKKDATDQLRKRWQVSIRIVSRVTESDVHVVTAQASTPDGRVDESTGAVPVGGLKGEALANALMKAETKAKRRVTLSICGLGMLDESEVVSIPGAQVIDVEVVRAEPAKGQELTSVLDAYITRVNDASDVKTCMGIYAEMVSDQRLPEASRTLIQAALSEQRKRLEGKAA